MNATAAPGDDDLPREEQREGQREEQHEAKREGPREGQRERQRDEQRAEHRAERRAEQRAEQPDSDGALAAAGPPPDPWADLRRHTPARIALGRSGSSLPTAEVLRFAAAHAQARDAVQVPLDVAVLAAALQADGWATLQVASRAATRDIYLRRPDLGRRLDADSAARLAALSAAQPAAQPAAAPDHTSPALRIVIGDGLSASAVQAHAVPLLAALRGAWARAQPAAAALDAATLVLATQARVALADEVGELLQAGVVLILLGERPGLSSPDSVGAYLTHGPRIGRSDAERNCVSNIRPAGLPLASAAARIVWLAGEALRLRLSGVALKDDSATALLTSA